MKLQYHGHSCFSIFINQTHLIIDPFLNHNPQSIIKASDINPDYVLVTHGHSDHFGDTLELGAKGATIISTAEIAEYCELKQMPSVHAMQIGGGYRFPFGYLKMVPATHGSAISDNNTLLGGGSPGGFLLKTPDLVLYHAGDTGLTMEMEMLARFEQIDIALLPIGGNYTMDPVDALRAIRILNPRYVIPMHYNTFPLIAQDVHQFAKEAERLGPDAIVLKIGETYNF